MPYIVHDSLRPSPSAFALAISANCAWGATFLASAWTLQVWDPITSTFVRFVLAGALLAIFVSRRDFASLLRSRAGVGHLLLLAVSGYATLYPLQLTGLLYLPTALSAVLMQTSPLLVVALSPLLLAEKPSTLLLALLIGAALLAALLVRETSSLGADQVALSFRDLAWGSLLTLLAALSLAVSVLTSRKLASYAQPTTYTSLSMLVGAALLAPLSLLEERNLLATLQSGEIWSPRHIGALTFLVIVASAAAFWMWNTALARAPATGLASTMYLKTPVAVVLGITVNNEPLSLPGLLLATALVLLVAISERTR